MKSASGIKGEMPISLSKISEEDARLLVSKMMALMPKLGYSGVTALLRHIAEGSGRYTKLCYHIHDEPKITFFNMGMSAWTTLLTFQPGGVLPANELGSRIIGQNRISLPNPPSDYPMREYWDEAGGKAGAGGQNFDTSRLSRAALEFFKENLGIAGAGITSSLDELTALKLLEAVFKQSRSKNSDEAVHFLTEIAKMSEAQHHYVLFRLLGKEDDSVAFTVMDRNGATHKAVMANMNLEVFEPARPGMANLPKERNLFARIGMP